MARTPGKAGKLAKYCLELHCENRDFMSAEICSILNTQILNVTLAQMVEQSFEGYRNSQVAPKLYRFVIASSVNHDRRIMSYL